VEVDTITKIMQSIFITVILPYKME
jgi:hypothetical protein